MFVYLVRLSIIALNPGEILPNLNIAIAQQPLIAALESLLPGARVWRIGNAPAISISSPLIQADPFHTDRDVLLAGRDIANLCDSLIERIECDLRLPWQGGALGFRPTW